MQKSDGSYYNITGATTEPEKFFSLYSNFTTTGNITQTNWYVKVDTSDA